MVIYMGRFLDARKYVAHDKTLFDLVTLKVDRLEGTDDYQDARNVKAELIDYVANKRGALYTKNICLDVRSAKRMDSEGLSAIIVYNRINRNLGANPLNIICEQGSQVEHLMIISQLDHVMNLYDDLSEL